MSLIHAGQGPHEFFISSSHGDRCRGVMVLLGVRFSPKASGVCRPSRLRGSSSARGRPLPEGRQPWGAHPHWTSELSLPYTQMHLESEKGKYLLLLVAGTTNAQGRGTRMKCFKGGVRGRQSCGWEWRSHGPSDTSEEVCYHTLRWILLLSWSLPHIMSWSSWKCSLIFIDIKFQVTDKQWILFIWVGVWLRI